MVSGTLSLFCPKCFSPFPHGTGSLSVSGEYLALPDGPGGFTQDSSCPALLRIPLCLTWLRVRDSHPLRPDFPDGSARHDLCNGAVLQPRHRLDGAGLGSSPFARHYWGNHCYFLFLRVLRCFSSPRWPHRQNTVIATSRWLGCPIRRPRDQGSFAPPPRLSQLTTSFVASRSQGIRHAPFPTFLFTLLPPPQGGRAHTSSSRCMVSYLLRFVYCKV